ncbi:MAG TPA: NAD-dependent epimerase/dehydratase family protein [Vicinamibacterales bacterium]|nr:NAD-dependent epimerase/dehydratase family protein [Vicinamibacterales bacterium]
MTSLTDERILITGGAGLIGSHIADRLVDHESVAEVIVLDNLTRGRVDNLAHAMMSGRVRVIEGDIRDRTLVARLMQNVDVVFHQAALRITQCADEPVHAMDVMINGTFTVLDAARDARVRKVVAASTASVYGMAERFPTAEDHHPYDNRTLYGAAKLFNEGLLRTFHDQHGLDYVALRYFNVYGPRMDTFGAYTEVLIRWMDRIESGQPPLIFGDGSQTMDFVHVADIARANVLAAKADVTDRVYNIATGTETSLNDLAAALLKVMGSSAQVEYGPQRKVNPVPRRLADVRRAASDLGFRAEIALEDGLQSLVAWWRDQRRALNA